MCAQQVAVVITDDEDDDDNAGDDVDDEVDNDEEDGKQVNKQTNKQQCPDCQTGQIDSQSTGQTEVAVVVVCKCPQRSNKDCSQAEKERAREV